MIVIMGIGTCISVQSGIFVTFRCLINQIPKSGEAGGRNLWIGRKERVQAAGCEMHDEGINREVSNPEGVTKTKVQSKSVSKFQSPQGKCWCIESEVPHEECVGVIDRCGF